jgi:4a-hydroxytetrahydrobiopterin dehydratase
MSELVARRCQPCTGETPRLSASEVSTLLPQVPGYVVAAQGEALSRTYQFKNYYQVMAFVNAVAWIAHAEDHHPDLTVSYDKVGVRYTTHAVGGLSENDFICAAKVNQLL